MVTPAGSVEAGGGADDPLGRPTIRLHGVALFNKADSYQLLARCRTRGIAVLGIEGFRLDGVERIPEMNYIADFSSVLAVADRAERVVRSIRYGEAFLALVPKEGVLLEFVLAEA
ncbi:MAG: hypothetical protein J0H01_00795 [Rhizobiales bacterium]|nr:hypothetical protein [Hyphomicrobiales bacterium]